MIYIGRVAFGWLKSTRDMSQDVSRYLPSYKDENTAKKYLDKTFIPVKVDGVFISGSESFVLECKDRK